MLLDDARGQPRGLSQPTKILLGLVLGAAVGLLLNVSRSALDAGVSSLFGQPIRFVAGLLDYVFKPIGQIFLRLLLMTVVPLVFASLAVGVAQLGDLRTLGRIGTRTLLYFLGTTAAAVILGLLLALVIRPGEGLSPETRDHLAAQFAARVEKTPPAEFGVDLIVNLFPRNPIDAMARGDMLAVIVFALLCGMATVYLPRPQNEVVVMLYHAIAGLMMFIINLAMKVAPFGVFALISSVTADLGLELIALLGKYVFVVLLGLALHFLVTLPLCLIVFGRTSPLWFFLTIRPVIITAFSTSSSNATLPTSIRCAEKDLGASERVAGFVLPLGATMNMNGTALFEGVTVLFLAQAFQVELSLGQQFVVLALAVVTAIGAAGVPGGSIPLLMSVLATAGVQPGAIAVILGVDRLLDMCRTTLNVVGDLTAVAYISRMEGQPLQPRPPQPPLDDAGEGAAEAPVPVL